MYNQEVFCLADGYDEAANRIARYMIKKKLEGLVTTVEWVKNYAPGWEDQA